MIKRKKNKPLSFIFMVVGIILSGIGVAKFIVEGSLFNIIWTFFVLLWTAMNTYNAFSEKPIGQYYIDFESDNSDDEM